MLFIQTFSVGRSMDRYRLFIANSGAGKSTLANCLAEKVLFKSGTSSSSSKTSQLGKAKHGDIMYLDTPGLTDIKIRQIAAKVIAEALRQTGKYQIFFVVTLSEGRLRPVDLATIWLVLFNTADIRFVNIIINKLSKEEHKRFKSNNVVFDSCVFSALKNMGRSIEYNVLPLLHNETLEDADDAIVKNPELDKFAKNARWIDVCSGYVCNIPGDADLKKQLDSLEKRITNLSSDQVPILVRLLSFLMVYLFIYLIS